VRHSSVKGDPDNIIGSFKAIIDGLKDAGVLADDRDVELVPRHVKAPQGKGMMEIIVEETR
jgi:Holliday junction resolvase RusA-like endonuclease